MMLNMKSIIGAGLGWTLLGPIGAIIGGIIGSQMDESKARRPQSKQTTSKEDFYASLMIIFSYVIKADNKIDKKEINYIKSYLMKTNSNPEFVQELMYLLKQILERDVDIDVVARQIAANMDVPSRIQLIHLLFELTLADGKMDESEKQAVERITLAVGLNHYDFESIFSSYHSSADNAAYTILEISPDAGIEDIKEAYKKQARLYHPDKVSHLGADLVKTAEEKFKNINDAYQKIRKERGF